MDSPAALLAIRLLVLDTFRQARASGLSWLMLGASGICILLCLSVHIEGDVSLGGDESSARPELLPRSDVAAASAAVAGLVCQSASRPLGRFTIPAPFVSREYQEVAAALRHGVPLSQGRLSLAFGAIPIEMPQDRLHMVRTFQCVLAGWVADAAGMLLALLWTAGFLPAFLKPSAVTVLLSKPMPRWSLLAGKWLGVLIFVAFQTGVFIFGTWLALAVKTGVWDPTYLLCLPVLLLHFSAFYSFSALLAVLSGSTVVCSIGSIFFWLVCWGMNFGRHMATGFSQLLDSQSFGAITELAYWVLPKPLDFHILLVDTLQAQDFTTRVVDLNSLVARGAWHPELSLASSLLSGVVLLGMAAYELVRADY
jgi:hypothetical protein